MHHQLPVYLSDLVSAYRPTCSVRSEPCHVIQVFIPFIAQDIAIIIIFVYGGGHHEFSHEKVDEKNVNSFFPVLYGQYK